MMNLMALKFCSTRRLPSTMLPISVEWPGSRYSTSSCETLSMLCLRVVMLPPGKSVRPTLPLNTRSPVIRTFLSGQ